MACYTTFFEASACAAWLRLSVCSSSLPDSLMATFFILLWASAAFAFDGSRFRSLSKQFFLTLCAVVRGWYFRHSSGIAASNWAFAVVLRRFFFANVRLRMSLLFKVSLLFLSGSRIPPHPPPAPSRLPAPSGLPGSPPPNDSGQYTEGWPLLRPKNQLPTRLQNGLQSSYLSPSCKSSQKLPCGPQCRLWPTNTLANTLQTR